MIEVIISAEEQAETSEMADDLLAQLGRVSGLRVRRMQRTAPGIASEPITTAILVAFLAQLTYKGADEFWSAVRKRVLKSRRAAKLAVKAPATQASEPVVIVITPALAADEKVPAALSQALGVEPDD
jgi:hypothetical protein